MFFTLLLLSLVPGGLSDAPAALDDAALLAPADHENAVCEMTPVETALFQFRVGFHNCSGVPCSSCEWCCEEACPWGDPCLGNCWDVCLENCF